MISLHTLVVYCSQRNTDKQRGHRDRNRETDRHTDRETRTDVLLTETHRKRETKTLAGTHRNRQKDKDLDRRYIDRDTQEQRDKDADRRYVHKDT